MTPSTPCAKCGQVDDLETVDPLGIHLDKAILWNCRCGNTRAVAVIDSCIINVLCEAQKKGTVFEKRT